MSKHNLPKSIRKYIRLAKAKIRKEVFDPQKQKESIAGLLAQFVKKQ
ncbi:hypothetical protein KKG36_00290 [Patescibacteria group bacterium]|nr:hypothetical protein [Patescibacteria group bacterium]